MHDACPVLEEVANSRAGYSIYKIDVDNNNELAGKLKIDMILTLCIYKDGKLVDRQVGYKDKEQIVELIENIINNSGGNILLLPLLLYIKI